MPIHRRLDPYSRARDAARDLARADPRNQRLHAARSVIEYLPWAALYPFQAENLLLLVVLGGGLWLGSASLFGAWLLLLVSAALMTYTLEVVAATANGYGAPPRFSAVHFGRIGDALLAVLPIVMIVVMVRVASAAGSVALAWIALGVGGCALPAIVVLVAIERALLAALDPRRWLVFLHRGGIAYWSIVALTVYALGASGGLVAPLGSTVDLIASAERLGALLGSVVTIYLTLVAAHLLGAMVFLRRAALGVAAALEPRDAIEESNESLQESVARLLKLADEEEHHGRHDAAVALLRTAPIGSHAPRPWLEQLFEGACRRPKPYFADAAGERLLGHLFAARQWARALEVVVLASQRWPRFEPASLDQRVLLATHALELGNALAFRQLTASLDGLVDAPQAVELGFLAARWSAERDGDADAARRRLAPLLAHTGHPAHRRIAALDSALRSAAAPPR